MTDTPVAISRKRLELSEIRAAPSKSRGRDYWRSLDELAATEEFREMLHREFPERASEWPDPVSRRNFLKVMGASLAFGGLTNCTIQPEEKIVPWVRAPENVIPGKPLYFATASTQGGVGTGILVESHMGRPTKIEGNPDHPASLGATDPVTQAVVLELYDPDRSRVVTNAGRISTWGNFVQSLTQKIDMLRHKNGDGLRILTETVTSPTLGRQLLSLREQLPAMQWHQYEPANRDAARAGSVLAYGEPVNTWFDFAKAQVVLSLDADFCGSGPGAVRYARDFAAGRRVRDGKNGLNRLYAVETIPSPTGSLADHRLPLDSGAIERLAATLARELGVHLESEVPAFEDTANWVPALARDLKKNAGASIVVAGPQQSPAVHALAHAINQALGNVGETVHYTDPLEVESVDHTGSLSTLVADMKAGEVGILLIIGGNPVYDAPPDLDFAGALANVEFRAQLSLVADETSRACHWHVPQAHLFESWGDCRAYDGTVSIIQPLIKPLFNGKSSHDLLAVLSGESGKPTLDIVRQTWEEHLSLSGSFDRSWKTSLHDGLVGGTALSAKKVSLRRSLQLPRGTGVIQDEENIELVVRPDPLLGGGRFSNNGWLQETPRPITQLTWDNAALVSPATAEELGVANEQVIELRREGRMVRAPVWIVPGQAERTLAVHLGYGRTRAGRVGDDAGFNAYPLTSSSGMWSTTDLKWAKTFDRQPLACTQDHHSMEDRQLVRHADLKHYEKNPHFVHEEAHEFPEELTLYNPDEFKSSTGYSWGMAIDLNACMGCNACSVACQAENNIPVVGKEEVLNGREMSWIRVDRYYTDLDDPEIYHQPVPCQQCENAPCELVCPVTATTHSEEGLNDMIYNRCVGTRYCSNNCPYKVRRFNFLQYSDRDTPSLKLQRNPDVTVRYRGVMEKCTYCTQRINTARIESKKTGDPISDGEIQTACQQACPTQAISFGNIEDPNSEVSRWKASDLNYGILTDLNTRPRTTYLGRVANPNPEIGKA